MPVLARGAMRALMTAVSVALLGSALVVTPAAAAGSVSVSTVLSGYSDPVFVTAPRGTSSRRIYIVERAGRIRVATHNGSRWVKEGTFLDIRGPVNSSGGEQGLLGLAFDPGYTSNGRFYVSYTVGDGDLVVAEYRRSSTTRANAGSRRQILRVNHPGHANHNGGMLAFKGQYLYISTGDGGGAGDPGNNARDKSSLSGKILRINPRPSGGRAYGIPSSNPYVGRTGSDLVWSFGLRNPWRFSFDRSNGDLWIGDVGQYRYEEVNVHSSGRGVNFGWDRCEGFRKYPSGGSCTTGRRPLKAYSHGSSHCSITGGYVYRGSAYPAWRGRYIYGDYCSGYIWVINKSGSVRASLNTSNLITSFGEDSSGRLYMVTKSGRIMRVSFSGTP
jgi:glucose/arabinose dehydrogenase